MSNLFRDARGILERDGWRKGAGGVGQPTCLIGALARAKGMDTARWWRAAASSPAMENESETPENKLLRRVIAELFPDDPDLTYHNLANIPWLWNDRAATTKEDVFAVLDRAAEIAEVEWLNV